TEKDVVKETSGNLATTRKEEIGRVLTFFRDKKVAKVVLRKGKYRIGDMIYFEGGDMGTYYPYKIKEMYHKNKKILETPETDRYRDGYVVTFKVDREIKKSDKIFRYIPKVKNK
ncbi:MAG: hypothetical protein ACTSXF_01715, partial [Promethearchaeota archaeon]